MFGYYTRLALSSLRQTPAVTFLMVGAIALGIGVSMTLFSTVYMLSGNPIPDKSAQLFAVQIDAWDPEDPFHDDKPTEPPDVLTYKDAVGVLGSGIPLREAPMFQTGFLVRPDNPDIDPFSTSGRLTSGDFFAMFEVPFIYGGPWSPADYDNAERVAVISESINDKLFGGQNSVGETLHLTDASYRVVGVTQQWNPRPKFYDLEGDPFADGEEIYAPFSLFQAYELPRNGSTRCWKDEEINTYQDLLNSECIWPNTWVELVNAEQRDQYMAFLNAYAAEQKSLGRHDRPVNNRLRNVGQWLEHKDMVGDEARVMVVIGFLFLIVCMVNTIGLLLARFLGKASTVGVRRALGASKRDVFQQHLIEVGLVGLIGGALGLLLTFIGFAGIDKLFPDVAHFTRLNLSLITIGLAIAVLSSLLAGLYPTWRICQLAPGRHLKTQ